jgi:amino acid transporter
MVINIYGVALASHINKIAVISEIVALLVFGLILLAVVLFHHEAQSAFLTTRPAQPTPYWPGFLLASLLAAWTLIGFEVPGDLSEETVNVKRVASQSIVTAVFVSIVLGSFFIGTLVLAIPDLSSVAAASDPISTIVAYHLGDTVMRIFLVFVLIAMFALALLVMAGGARILYAVARDRHVVGASFLTKISAHKVPHNAIICITVLELIVFLFAKDAVDIYAASTVLFFIVYLITVVSFAFGLKKLPPPGGFSLKGCRTVVTVFAILWLMAMICVLTMPEEFHHAAQIAGAVLLVCLVACVLTQRKTKAA